MTPPLAFTGHDLVCVRGERVVFRGLSFAVKEGGALLLTGPNGSGKSSLLRLMAGLLPPFMGDVRWGGLPIRSDTAAHRARLHYLGHQDAIKAVLTTGETIAFWAGLRGGNATTARAALARFRLDALADQPCRFLSAGQRRRLALARLVATDAPLWLLDEPTTGLDAAAVRDLESVIADHRARGGMVAVSTHIPVEMPGAEELTLGAFDPGAFVFEDEAVSP